MSSKTKLKSLLLETRVPSHDEWMKMSKEDRELTIKDLKCNMETIATHLDESIMFTENRCVVCGSKNKLRIKESNVFFKKYCDRCFPKQPEVQKSVKKTIEGIFGK